MHSYPYILRDEMEMVSLFNTWLVSGCKLKYLDCILAEPKEGCSRPLQHRCNNFVIKNIPKMVFMFPFTK